MVRDVDDPDEPNQNIEKLSTTCQLVMQTVSERVSYQYNCDVISLHTVCQQDDYPAPSALTGNQSLYSNSGRKNGYGDFRCNSDQSIITS